ncbi:MAG: RNA 3'-terminal phosphate cyclase, partial [Pseudomonas sp.]
VRISGGTHNPLAPPADFLELAWLPLLRRMGARVELQLLRHGFVPAGGGELELRVRPGALRPLQLERRGAVLRQQARALLAGLPGHIGERELERVAQRLKWPASALRFVRLDEDRGPGNALLLEIACEQVTELFCAFGQPGVRAERVADQAIDQARDWLASEAAVAEQLADQLLLPLALAGGGSFTCNRVTAHLRSNLAVIQRFLPLDIRLEERAANLTRVVVGAPIAPP